SGVVTCSARRSGPRREGSRYMMKGGDEMPNDETQLEYKPLTSQELEELAGEPLPERAVMSLVNANVAVPVNLALAANVLSDGSVAYADAAQQTPIDQGNL